MTHAYNFKQDIKKTSTENAQNKTIQFIPPEALSWVVLACCVMNVFVEFCCGAWPLCFPLLAATMKLLCFRSWGMFVLQVVTYNVTHKCCVVSRIQWGQGINKRGRECNRETEDRGQIGNPRNRFAPPLLQASWSLWFWPLQYLPASSSGPCFFPTLIAAPVPSY